MVNRRQGVLPRQATRTNTAATYESRFCGHRKRTLNGMSPTWIWLQGAIVLFVIVGMLIALIKLA